MAYEHFPIGVNGKIMRSNMEAFHETEDSFEERVRKAQEKINLNEITPTMDAIAKNILHNHFEIDIYNAALNEEEIAPFCDDYDPASIIAICRKRADASSLSH